MESKVKFDQYMICLEVMEYYPDANVMFWLNYLTEHIPGKIHIVSFRSIKKEIQSRYASDKYIWRCEIALSYSEIDKYIRERNREDAVVIVGGERLVQHSSDKVISSLKYEEKTSNLHLQEDEDWSSFSKSIDMIYEKNQLRISGLVLICNVNNTIADVINEELKNSKNISICRTEMIGYNSESSEHAMKVIKEIRNKSLQDSLQLIEEKKNIMDKEQVTICQAIAYHNNGNITKSIYLLNSIYESLSNELKLFLARMYVLQELRNDAKRIFEELYKKDKWQKGLFELGLDVYRKEEKRYSEIISEAIKYQSDNIFFIEKYANWLVNHEKYNEAASWFRKIEEPYFELIARINDLLFEKQTDIKIIKSYLFEIIEKNPELKNTALLKVALYAMKLEHYYNAYNLLREADLHEFNDVTQEILKKKIEILNDTERACKALGKLKPYRKERDNEILLGKRCALLLESINFFSHTENGYYHWRKLLKCQQQEIWNISIKKYVLKCIIGLKDSNMSELLSESYIRNLNLSEEHLNCDTAIYFLRKSNKGEIPPEKYGCTREEVVNGSCNLIEMQGTNIQRLWLRYYCSIGASALSENPQEATAFSLGLLEFGKITECSEQQLMAALYLMSWGNLQFRLGNMIEGLSCTLVSIRQLLNLNEVIPIVEEGLNILSQYLWLNDSIFSESEKNEIVECILILERYNESLEPLRYKYMDDMTEILQKYEKRVNECNNKDSRWLIDLNNLISGKVKNKEYDEAVRYIKENYLFAKDLIVQRRDIAAKLYYNWGGILIKFRGSIENVLLGLEMLDNALNEVQKRKQVYHQEERAALAEEYEQIIREYLCFSGMYYAVKDIDKETKKRLKENILGKMSICLPMSVIEQKRYYMKNEISDELEEKHHRLQNLKREYAIILKSNSVEDNNVQEIAHKIELLSKELIHNHPYYMPLEKFEGTNWNELQKNLISGEVVYQYILTEMVMISVVLTNEWIDVRAKFFDTRYDDLYSGMKKYGHIIESDATRDDEIRYYSSVISEVVAEHLCDFIFNYQTSSVYVIPDISKSIFPIAAVQYKGTYLIDKVEKIINFIDYSQLINYLNDKTYSLTIANKVFGKKSDASIAYIIKWLEEHARENVVSFTDCSDNLKTMNVEGIKDINTLAIYGHGAKDPASEIIEGAQTIQGAKGMIKIRDILDEINVKNFILISCVGGSPNSSNPEISSGTWTSIFERFNGNVIACRWSVPTEDTIRMMDKLYDNLLNEKMSFAEALVKAQREMKDSGKNQLSWAGIECWVN